jgi:hypothetical protein
VSKPFSEYTYDDAAELFADKVEVSGGISRTIVRRTTTAVAASDFHGGDHWQNGSGFIGQFPPAGYPGASTIIADIKKRFESENAIKEVVETHLGGLLGREPLWSVLKEAGTPGQDKPERDDVTGEIITTWWNEREALKDLQKSAEVVVLEGISVKRIFFPKSVPAQPRASNLNEALDFIYFQTLTADKGGVFTDPDTQQKVGVYLYEEKDDEGNITANCAELSYLNDDGDTVCRVVRDKGDPSEFGPYKLGGRLLIFEIQRSPLITEQVQSLQKSLNLAHTMMTRNVNLAGSRERSVTNAQPPKQKVRTQSATDSAAVTSTEPGPYETGAGAVMFLMGYPIRNEKGDIVGYTNPNINITDPASVEVFLHTRKMKYEAILSQCHQRHVLISGDATASGVSRKSAEKEWQRSLKDTKTGIDAMGRWHIETPLRLAAQICGQSNQVINLRADFNCLLDTGDPSSEEISSVIACLQPLGPKSQPLISYETARNKIGIDDAAAELKRIEEESLNASEPPPIVEEIADKGEELIA